MGTNPPVSLIHKTLPHALGPMLHPESKFEIRFQTAHDAIGIVEDGRCVDCNPAAVRMFGRSREEILPHRPSEFSPLLQPDGGNSADQAAKRIGSALAGTPQNFEWVHLRPDGPAFPTEVSLTCFEWKRKLLLQAIVRDVSERRHTEQTWRESEERYRARFDRSFDCLFVHDLEGRFLDANAAAPALLGYEGGFGPGVFEHRAEGASRISANQITHAGCQTEGCPGGAAPEW